MASRMLLAATCGLALVVGFRGPAKADNKAEVLHWWTSGGESAAVHVFSEQFAAAGGVWVDTAIAGGEAARSAGINRIVGGHPPTAMQFNTGKQFDELVTSGYVATLDAVAKDGNWAAVVPPAFMQAVTRDGHIYAVPVNIHGQNWLWYNTAVLEKAGVAAPKTWDDVVASLDKIKATGVIPLALGGQSWQEAILFNAILLGQGGRAAYDAVYVKHDAAAVKTPAFRAAAETFGKLRGYVDPGSPGRNWNDATSMVITGKAAMQVMGDWAKGELIAASIVPGQQVGCALPGHEVNFLMGGDIFMFPKSADKDQTATQMMLAKVLIDPVTQVKFNAKKGSIPVRSDVDASSLDACAQIGIKAVADPKGQVPNIDLLISADLAGALRDVTTAFWNTPSMTTDIFIQKFGAAMSSTD